MTRTAVVILNFNGEKFLRQFLPSVVAHSREAEVIVSGPPDRPAVAIEMGCLSLPIGKDDQNFAVHHSGLRTKARSCPLDARNLVLFAKRCQRA